MVRAAILAGAGLLLAAGSTLARTWLITPDGSGDAPTIQAAIDSAAAGDAVVLSCGTFTESGIRLRSHVTLASATGYPGCATIDGAGDGPVLFGERDTTSVTGLTLRGGRSDYGGGMYLDRCDMRIVDCVIEDNEALFNGGGVEGLRSTLLFESCVVARNAQTYSGGVSNGGGGLAIHATDATLRHCTIVDNSSVYRGGAIRGDIDATIVLEQTIVAFNRGILPFASQGSHFEIFSVTCLDVFGNEYGDHQLGDSTCIFTDPLFCSRESGDFTLQWGSPCLPDNSDGCALIGAYGFGGCGSIAVRPETWASIKSRYLPR